MVDSSGIQRTLKLNFEIEGKRKRDGFRVWWARLILCFSFSKNERYVVSEISWFDCDVSDAFRFAEFMTVVFFFLFMIRSFVKFCASENSRESHLGFRVFGIEF